MSFPLMRYLAPVIVGSLVAGLPFVSAAQESENLVAALWQAQNESELMAAGEALLAAASDTTELYNWLQEGPTYSSEVARGEQLLARTAADGTEFPYMVYVPDSYDPAKQYAAEFVLHGGVSRAKPAAGETFWKRTFDRVRQEDRIIVVPAAWADSFWWQDSQAENLPAILNDLKARYNIDENRVSLTGISDGGTGAYFFAFKQPTQWSVFLPYIGHPGVLRNPNSGGGYRLYFENLMGKPLYIVNGENDRLYPSASLGSFIEILQQAGVNHTWRVIAGGGHNTNWLPDELDAIEQFKQVNPRDPFPDSLQWVVDRTDRYNRNHWIQVDATEDESQPSLLEVTRTGNEIAVNARGVSQFTLLLNPEEVNFANNIVVKVNGDEAFNAIVQQDSETLLRWAARDRDRSMLVTAELTLDLSE